MGVANAMASAATMRSPMAAASSFSGHAAPAWQAKHPRQNSMRLPRRLTVSTSWPASRAPSANASARACELLVGRRLADTTRTLFPMGFPLVVCDASIVLSRSSVPLGAGSKSNGGFMATRGGGGSEEGGKRRYGCVRSTRCLRRLPHASRIRVPWRRGRPASACWAWRTARRGPGEPRSAGRRERSEGRCSRSRRTGPRR